MKIGDHVEFDFIQGRISGKLLKIEDPPPHGMVPARTHYVEFDGGTCEWWRRFPGAWFDPTDIPVTP